MGHTSKSVEVPVPAGHPWGTKGGITVLSEFNALRKDGCVRSVRRTTDPRSSAAVSLGKFSSVVAKSVLVTRAQCFADWINGLRAKAVAVNKRKH